MNMLMQSLGLENVEADPNAIPDGKYDGVVFKSEYVLLEKKDTISHVITYKVTEGDRKGAERTEWFTLGKEPRDANGAFPSKVEEIANYTNTQTENNKQWYKKRFVDLGVAEEQIPTLDVTTLVGTPVTFGVKRNQGYININFVEVRDEAAATTTGPTSLTAPVSLSATSGGAASAIAGGLV